MVSSYANGALDSNKLKSQGPAALTGGRYVLKLLLDRVMAAFLLVLLLPAIGAIAVAIKMDSEGPVLYRQVRVGRRGQIFVMYKFRSMVQDAARYQALLAQIAGQESSGIFKMRQDPRITRLGRFLRRTSLDELPQVFNVLRGEMSLVGPRPPLVSEATRERRHMSRMAAMPGMTGLWQVKGRSDLPFEVMTRLDLEYIATWSLLADWIILLKTLPAVLSRRGAY